MKVIVIPNDRNNMLIPNFKFVFSELQALIHKHLIYTVSFGDILVYVKYFIEIDEGRYTFIIPQRNIDICREIQKYFP